MDTDEASLPYAGTEGYSGSDTSRQRAMREATEGIASKRQRYVLILAAQAGEKGVTVADLRDAAMHHGRVSGTLSVLHKEGRLVRLSETRERCKVYVLPQYANERATEAHGRRQRQASPEVMAAATRVEDFFAGLKGPFHEEALFDVEHGLTQGDIQLLASYAKGRVD